MVIVPANITVLTIQSTLVIVSHFHSSDGGQAGQWSTDGCKVVGRRTVDDHDYVTCECSHLTSFGVLMDRSDIEVSGDWSLDSQCHSSWDSQGHCIINNQIYRKQFMVDMIL